MTARETIPLFPRRRLRARCPGGQRVSGVGEGSDVAGSRPYRPGDRSPAIDWKASARLSAARGSDEFIVRERFAEETPRVVLICDRRPEMALSLATLPWLHKPEAVAHAAEVIVASALNERGLVGYLDYGSHDGESDAGTPFWRASAGAVECLDRRPRRAHARLSRRRARRAARTTSSVALRFLGRRGRDRPAGQLRVVLSTFSSVHRRTRGRPQPTGAGTSSP